MNQTTLPETHFIPYDAPHIGRAARAVCTSLVSRSSHSNEPTCPVCKQHVDADNAVTAEDLFGDGSDMRPVRSTYGNSLAGYRPREVAPFADQPATPARDRALDRWRKAK